MGVDIDRKPSEREERRIYKEGWGFKRRGNEKLAASVSRLAFLSCTPFRLRARNSPF